MITLTAYEDQKKKFDQKMKSIKDLNSKVADELDRVTLELWALAHEGGKRYGALTSKLSESFNGVLRGARHLPITALVQQTFYKCVSYFWIIFTVFK